MPAATSSWTLPAAAPVPKRSGGGSAWRPDSIENLAALQPALAAAGRAPVHGLPAAPLPRAAQPPRKPSLIRQMAMGLGIFAGILAASVPLVYISEGLALAVAVGLGALLLALLARRLLIAPMIAALLAVLGAFATAHSVHLARTETTIPIRLAELAPASGLQAGGAPPSIAMVMPIQAQVGSRSMPIAGWAFPAALFALWAAGFGAIRGNQLLVRWLLRRFGDQLRNVQI